MRRLLALLVVTSALSCASGGNNITRLTPEHYAPTVAADVKLYYTNTPSEPYVEIGRLSVGKQSWMGKNPSQEQLARQIRELASSIGGDGVVRIEEDLGNMRGIVIRFRDRH